MKHDPAALLHRAPPGTAPLTGAPYLRLHNISKRFGQQQVLSQLDLDIAKGEFVCLLGPSGCGKTTLLRQIAGLDAADSGRIELAGRDITRLPPAARDYGIVFQSYALFPNLTVADNIGYGLGGARTARRQRVQDLLALIGLDGIAERYPAQLSGGQQQRVALARALATSPGLLLLDEPLSALDARVREHLRREIRALQQKLGITTLMVTHDQEEALTMDATARLPSTASRPAVLWPALSAMATGCRRAAVAYSKCNWVSNACCWPHRMASRMAKRWTCSFARKTSCCTRPGPPAARTPPWPTC